MQYSARDDDVNVNVNVMDELRGTEWRQRLIDPEKESARNVRVCGRIVEGMKFEASITNESQTISSQMFGGQNEI